MHLHHTSSSLRHLEPAGAAFDPLKEVALRPLEAFTSAVAARAPAVLSALGLLLAMWLLARLARALVTKLLGLTKLDAVTEKTQLGKLLKAFDEGMTTSKAVAALIYVAILLMALMSAADLLGLTTVSEALSGALAYVPRLVSVLVVLGVGGYIASAARRAVGAMLKQLRSPYGGPLEAVTETGILIIVAAVAVDLLGVDISFLTANLSLIIGVLLVTLAFLFSWSMRRPAEEIIANYYLRRMINPGDRINLGDVEGTVEAFTGIGVLLRDSKGAERFVPARHVLDGLTCTGRARRRAGGKEGER